MENARKLITGAAAYCVTETALLMSAFFLLPSFDRRWFSWAFILSQVVALPGFAAVLFRLQYGNRHLLRRTVVILAIGIIGCPVAALMPLCFVASIVGFYLDPENRWLACLLFAGSGAVLTGICFFVKRSSKWAREREVALWVEEQRQGVQIENRRARTKAMRAATALPVIVVSFLYLFFLPTWALVSHLRPTTSPGYNIRIPSTWVVGDSMQDYPRGNSYVSGILPCDDLPHVSPRRCMGAWYIGAAEYGHTARDNWWPRPVRVTRGEHYSLGDEDVTCYVVDYGFGGWPDHVCTGRSRLRVSYLGPPGRLTDFQQMMRNAVHMP